jgi:hypothetical protein
MDDTTQRPGLTIIDGGRTITEQPEKLQGRTACNEHGLTVKQEEFAKGLSEGLSNAEAYRRAYAPQNAKQSTIHENASRMAGNPKVKARVAMLVGQKAQRTQLVGARTADRIMTAIWKLAEDSDAPAAARVSALTLAAKMSGLLTDKVEVKTVPDKAEDLEQELRQRLEKFAKPS